jgi:septum formation protein
MTTRRRKRFDWILASSSPRRREILFSLGLRFRVDPSSRSEPVRRPREDFSAYAVRVAKIKAREVANRHRSGIVIGADTIVVIGDRLMGKPSSAHEAGNMLRSLSSGWHEVITGICLFDCRSGRSHSTSELSRVHFRRVSAAEADWYIGTGEYADKAGAYAIQGYGSLFIDRIEGCYFNIVGFPIAAFERLCRRAGVDLKRELGLRPG